MPDANDDPEFGQAVLGQLFDLWVGPELVRRGVELARDEIRKVVVELSPGQPPRVLIDEEAAIIGRFVADRPIAKGEEIRRGDVREIVGIEPHGLDPNSGWICFARLPTGEEFVAFDFTYNRGTALALLERAEEYLGAAHQIASTSLNVAVDNLFSAAELAVQVEMLTLQSETQNHRVRAEWLAGWAELGNAPTSHADTLWTLADLRKRARYGSEMVVIKPHQLDRMLRVVREMLDRARARLVRAAE